jgi:quercetin dioxygenase-like cupin family protein
MGNFKLRTRRLIIDVNGVVPTHDHADRPSIVYILSGEILEHNAYFGAPILHKAGDVAPESGPGHIH